MSVTVLDDTGHRLKIPVWMVSPEAAHYRLSDQATFAMRALKILAELVESVANEGFAPLE
jgi:hypothetical protein